MDSPAEILRRHRLRPKKSWGQNFLADPDVLRRIAESLGLRRGETVVELGPGLGHLTEALLATGARVIAVERDRDMIAVLTESVRPNLMVIAGNAATVNFREAAGESPVAVVGNLPYHLTSPILFNLLEQRMEVTRAVMTVQKEVADRLSASPGNRDYGLLSVLLGLYFEVEMLFSLGSNLFFPPPHVESAVIRLTTLPTPRAPIPSDSHFRKVVKAAFAQRRKTVLNSLQSASDLGNATTLSEGLSVAGVDPKRRAETMTVEEFAALSSALSLLADRPK